MHTMVKHNGIFLAAFELFSAIFKAFFFLAVCIKVITHKQPTYSLTGAHCILFMEA